MNGDKIKLFYLLILVIASMVLRIIYSKVNENIGNKREVNSFKGMLLSFMAYTLVDLRLLSENFYTFLPRVLVLFIMGTGFLSMSTACYFWLIYVLSGVHLRIKNTCIMIARVPIFIITIILFTPLYRLVYEVNDIPVFKPSLLLIVLTDYVYLTLATVISIHQYFYHKSKLERRRYLSQILFILLYTLSGFIVSYFMNIPTIELCMMPVILKIFVDLQDSRIYTDALTKLANRRRINEYIEKEIAACSEESPLTVIMIDVDFFKSINDVLGHDKGDEVLIVFSKALMKLITSKNAMAARWGGDEFVVAGKDKELGERFKEKLNEELENLKELSFMPLFSVGTYSCTDPGMTTKQVVTEADSILYGDKEIQHRKADEFHRILRNLKKNDMI